MLANHVHPHEASETLQTLLNLFRCCITCTSLVKVGGLRWVRGMGWDGLGDRVIPEFLWLNFHTCNCVSAVVRVDEETGMKRYPFFLDPVPRLHWEDPTADHLMTHEVGQEGSWCMSHIQP